MNVRCGSSFLVAVLLLLAACSSGSGHATPTTTTTTRTTTTLLGPRGGDQPAGGALVAVPNVVGKGQLNASNALLRARLRVRVASRGNETVTDQKPAAGKEVPAGTVVTLVIASRDQSS